MWFTGVVGKIDLERIAAAGLAIVDRDGADALAIRAVADVLDVTPMALYRHLDGKEALVALVVETALRERPLPDENVTDWIGDLWTQANWVRDGHKRHPAIARLRVRYRVWPPSALAIAERWLRAWTRSGLEGPTMEKAARASAMSVVGIIDQEIFHQDVSREQNETQVGPSSVNGVFGAPLDADEIFQLLVHSIIGGLYSSLSPSPPYQQRVKRRRLPAHDSAG